MRLQVREIKRDWSELFICIPDDVGHKRVDHCGISLTLGGTSASANAAVGKGALLIVLSKLDHDC